MMSLRIYLVCYNPVHQRASKVDSVRPFMVKSLQCFTAGYLFHKTVLYVTRLHGIAKYFELLVKFLPGLQQFKHLNTLFSHDKG